MEGLKAVVGEAVSEQPSGIRAVSPERPMQASQNIVISNALGLHARPAMQFVDLANQFRSSISVHKPANGHEPAVDVDGKSVMQMITLEATQGTTLLIEAAGDDAHAAIEQLARLVQDKFGEEE
jgi:phosphocarrier protein HPr